jgi:protoheme IX farnesyltransferase
MLGWVAATGDFGIEAGTLFFNFFGNSSFWAIGWFCMKIMKRFFLCCQQGKKEESTALQVILYTGWHYSVITAFLRLLVGYLYLLWLQLYFLLGVWMLFMQ